MNSRQTGVIRQQIKAEDRARKQWENMYLQHNPGAFLDMHGTVHRDPATIHPLNNYEQAIGPNTGTGWAPPIYGFRAPPLNYNPQAVQGFPMYTEMTDSSALCHRPEPFNSQSVPNGSHISMSSQQYYQQQMHQQQQQQNYLVQLPFQQQPRGYSSQTPHMMPQQPHMLAATHLARAHTPIFEPSTSCRSSPSSPLSARRRHQRSRSMGRSGYHTRENHAYANTVPASEVAAIYDHLGENMSHAPSPRHHQQQQQQQQPPTIAFPGGMQIRGGDEGRASRRHQLPNSGRRRAHSSHGARQRHNSRGRNVTFSDDFAYMRPEYGSMGEAYYEDNNGNTGYVRRFAAENRNNLSSRGMRAAVSHAFDDHATARRRLEEDAYDLDEEEADNRLYERSSHNSSKNREVCVPARQPGMSRPQFHQTQHRHVMWK